MNNKIIIYDFDGTLTPYPIPILEILEKSGFKNGNNNPEFLKLVKEKNNEDVYRSIYETCFEVVKKSGIRLSKENLSLGYDKVIYNKGVKEFLQMLNNNNIKNYLLSSGMKVFLEKVVISKYFYKIFATTFHYNKTGEATDIDYLMNDKNKVEAIKEILKENNYQENDCSNLIYIGDGLTDLYAMEYIKQNGGLTIFVYQNEEKEVSQIKEKNIVSLFTLADYSVDSELFNYIKRILKF